MLILHVSDNFFIRLEAFLYNIRHLSCFISCSIRGLHENIYEESTQY